MKNKNLVTTLVLVALVMIIGVSYAFFSYTRTSTKNSQLIAGQVYMHFNETGDSISLTNAFPETDSEAREKTNNYITFTIDGVNTTKDRDIYYEILLVQGSEQSGKTRLNDSHLKFDLVETSNIGGVETTNTVLSGVSYEEINNSKIWVNTIPANTTSEVTITYQLRMWISDKVIISDTLETADYTTSEFANSYASIKVVVKGDFDKKQADDYIKPPTAAETLIEKVGTNGLVAVNTDGSLASSGDTIREYRYSGSAKYCTYTVDSTTYSLAVEGDTCPNACDTGTYLYTYKETMSSCSGTTVSPNQTSPIDGEVDNYIWFNNEMWRIIGVFTETTGSGTEEELVKIVREVPLTNAEVPTTYTYNGTEMTMKYTLGNYANYQYTHMYWNYDTYFSQTNYNDWTKAATQYYLNDETSGAGSYYNSIDATYQNMIETVQYDISNVDYGATASVTYTAERSGNKYDGNEATWTGKIGMMYPSDYAYAAESDAWSVVTSQYGYKTQTATLSNWMNDNTRGYEWTMSPSSDNPLNAVRVSITGRVNTYDVRHVFAVSPVLYLKSGAVITGGDGSEGNPYTLA